MKHIAVNPYLPGWKYVPDGEPHIFDGRLYVFGSHDRAHGIGYCEEDYVVWSAPPDDLGDWRYEGVSYRKDQDPHNPDGKLELWAPDVCKGADGRYYLYYALRFFPEIGVAVSDKPAGPYAFYGHLKHKNGEIWHEDMPFDPAILAEDKDHIWLYSGFGVPPLPDNVTPETIAALPQFQNTPESAQTLTEDNEGLLQALEIMRHPSKNCSCLRLAPDMLTVLESSPVAPAQISAKGTSFEAHPFFEASSIRKIGDTYYLVYSSIQGNELCYATSKHPDKGFVFGGVIISNGDLGYKGNTKRRAFTANNHGGMVEVNGQWYIFYHRHTNLRQYSRQGCAEPITILADGSISQVEMTSCGLNGGPLPARERFSAHICCNVMGADGAKDVDNGRRDRDPFITEENNGGSPNQFVHNLQAGAVCGVKYIGFRQESGLKLVLRGQGTLAVKLDAEDGETLCEVSADSEDWAEYAAQFQPVSGEHAIYFVCLSAERYVDFSEFQFV
jgi:hypothetical protein